MKKKGQENEIDLLNRDRHSDIRQKLFHGKFKATHNGNGASHIETHSTTVKIQSRIVSQAKLSGCGLFNRNSHEWMFEKVQMDVPILSDPISKSRVSSSPNT